VHIFSFCEKVTTAEQTHLPEPKLPYLGCQWCLAVSSLNQDSVAPECLTLSAVSFIKELQKTVVES
jgi:hypothetical protein